MALATQTHLEKFLQINVTTEPDAAVTMLLENASGLIHSHLDRYLELSSYSESHSPPPGPALAVRQWPIDQTSNAVTVTENGTALTINVDFKVDEPNGQIIRTTTSGRARDWKTAGGPLSITVTYDAGYDMTVDPLLEPEAVTARDTCTRIAGRVFQASAAYANAPTGAEGVKTLTIAGSDSVTYSDVIAQGVTLAAPQLTDSDKEALRPLGRNVVVS